MGLVLTADPRSFAQESSDGGTDQTLAAAADGGARWPHGAGGRRQEHGHRLRRPRPAERSTANVETPRVSGGERIGVDSGPAGTAPQPRRRRRRERQVRGGASVRSGGGSGGGGGRVAVPRGAVAEAAGRAPQGSGARGGGAARGRYYGGGRTTAAAITRGITTPYYYPYSSFYYGVGYFRHLGLLGRRAGGATTGWGLSYAYGGYPYGGYGYGGYDTGRLRLEVQPRDAEVFIDGYLRRPGGRLRRPDAGPELETGGYNVEIRKPGWETLTFDVRVTPGRTTYKASRSSQASGAGLPTAMAAARLSVEVGTVVTLTPAADDSSPPLCGAARTRSTPREPLTIVMMAASSCTGSRRPAIAGQNQRRQHVERGRERVAPHRHRRAPLAPGDQEQRRHGERGAHRQREPRDTTAALAGPTRR